MMGAAVATLVGFLVIAVGSYYCSERLFAMNLPVSRVLRGLGVAIAIYFLDGKLTLGTLAGAIGVKVILLAGFAAVLRYWLLSRGEIATLASLQRSARAKATRFLRFGFATA
jgi:hypothetical protein